MHVWQEMMYDAVKLLICLWLELVFVCVSRKRSAEFECCDDECFCCKLLLWVCEVHALTSPRIVSVSRSVPSNTPLIFFYWSVDLRREPGAPSWRTIMIFWRAVEIISISTWSFFYKLVRAVDTNFSPFAGKSERASLHGYGRDTDASSSQVSICITCCDYQYIPTVGPRTHQLLVSEWLNTIQRGSKIMVWNWCLFLSILCQEIDVTKSEY